MRRSKFERFVESWQLIAAVIALNVLGALLAFWHGHYGVALFDVAAIGFLLWVAGMVAVSKRVRARLWARHLQERQ